MARPQRFGKRRTIYLEDEDMHVIQAVAQANGVEVGVVLRAIVKQHLRRLRTLGLLEGVPEVEPSANDARGGAADAEEESRLHIAFMPAGRRRSDRRRA